MAAASDASVLAKSRTKDSVTVGSGVTNARCNDATSIEVGEMPDRTISTTQSPPSEAQRDAKIRYYEGERLS